MARPLQEEEQGARRVATQLSLIVRRHCVTASQHGAGSPMMRRNAPPPLLKGNAVLEYVAFTGGETRTARRMFDAGGGQPAAVKGLAICLNRNRELPSDVLYLYYCTDDWRVDRVQAWNWPGGGPRANSTDTIKLHAEAVYAGLGRWTQVCSLDVARAKWWEP